MAEERHDADVLRSYEGEGILIGWEPTLCIHVANCIRALPHVFDPNARPWVSPVGVPPRGSDNEFHLIAREKPEEHLLSTHRLAYLIPIGGALVILHTIIHTLIDIDYLARGKTPPERQRSGH